MSDHDYELVVIGGGPALQRVSPARRENQVCAHDVNLTFVSDLRVIKVLGSFARSSVFSAQSV